MTNPYPHKAFTWIVQHLLRVKLLIPSTASEIVRLVKSNEVLQLYVERQRRTLFALEFCNRVDVNQQVDYYHHRGSVSF
jgi:hypothetical protein